MDNTFLATEAHVLAVVAGVVFGSAAISSACWVWLRKQIFAYGGSALCGAGVVLLGLSIWHSVEFGVTGTGLSLKLQAELEQKVEAIGARVVSVQEESTVTQKRLVDLNDKNMALEKAVSDARAYADLAGRAPQATSAIATGTAETGRQIVTFTGLNRASGRDAERATLDVGHAIEKAAHETGLAVDKAAPLKLNCRSLGLAC